jgi:hypothetical protein
MTSFEPLSEAHFEEKLQLASSVFQKHRRPSFAEGANRICADGILEGETQKCVHRMTLEMGKPLNAAMAALAAVQWCALVGRAENAEKFWRM